MEETQDTLRQALHSRDDRHKVNAIFRAVEKNLTELAGDVLELMKEERDTYIKGRCAWALGRLNYKEAYPALVSHLRHPSAEVRLWSAWALGEMRLERTAKHLQQAMESEEEDDVASAMGGAIKKLSGQPVRKHRSQVRKEIDALKLPFTEDRVIGMMVHRLERLKWPEDKEEILELREKIKSRDSKYFAALIKWALRRPVLWKALDDDDMVFS